MNLADREQVTVTVASGRKAAILKCLIFEINNSESSWDVVSRQKDQCGIEGKVVIYFSNLGKGHTGQGYTIFMT